jgi:hypothetical protein
MCSVFWSFWARERAGSRMSLQQGLGASNFWPLIVGYVRRSDDW